jgi:hypothetical protein
VWWRGGWSEGGSGWRGGLGVGRWR